MQRRSVLIWVLAALALQGASGPVRADQGRGRGRGGDDDGKDDGSDDENGDDDDKDDDDKDDDDKDDDGGDDDGGDDDGGEDDGGDSSGAGGKTAGNGRLPEVETDTLVIRYADGSAERLRRGRYQRIDARGAVVEDRPGRHTDKERLAVARPGHGQEMVIRMNSRTNEAETTDRNGWRELIVRGTYLLTDPNGNVVRRRGVRASDIARIHQLAGG